MLVGREAEVDEVATVVANRGTLLLAGPAGIGKTTVARVALGSDDTWAEGGALATLAWVPYLVFRRMIGTDVTGEPAAVAGSVARSLSRRGCTALMIDDAQWADDASLDVVAELAGHFAIVATVRTDEPRSREVIDAFACLGSHTVDLAPLSDDDAHGLVSHHAPDLSDADRASIVSHAAGNPLLLSELPHGDPDDPSLVSALLGRSRGLGASGHAALERLAVLGHPSPPELIGEGAIELLASGLTVESGGLVAVRHPLLAEVLVESMMTRADAVRLELAAQVPAAEAAHLLAAAGEPAAARERALEAAEATTKPLDRAQLLTLAIECDPDDSSNHEMRIAAAEAFCDVSRYASAAEVCAVDDDAVADPTVRGELHTVAARAAWLTGDTETCRHHIDLALADLRGTDTPAEVYVMAGSTILDTRIALDGRPALSRAHDAVALADRIGAHRGFARARLASVLFTAGEPGWADIYAEAVDDAARNGQPEARRSATTSLVLAHWLTGNAAEAYRLASEDIDRGPDHDHDGLSLSINSYAAMIGLLVGVERGRLIERHRGPLADEPVFRTRLMLATAVGLALIDARRFGEVDALLAVEHAVASTRPLDRSLANWLAAETAWAAGRLEEAIAAAESTVTDDGHPATIQRALIGAHATRQLGYGELSASLPAQPFRAWQAAPLEWQALRAAVEGRHGEATTLFETAATQWDGNDVRSASRCRWAAGDEARLAGSDDAVALLTTAADAAARWGLGPIADRARASLRRCGRSGRLPQHPGRSGLTSREEEILRLVGAGRSSKEIAAALALSVPTVESFVRTAVRKLGATNRLTAAAQLSRSDPPSA